MAHKLNEELFTIGQACRATGVSRSTIMRLEKSGFLKPREIDERTGYRYYDCYNISTITQYVMMRELGLDKTESVGYLLREVAFEDKLLELKARVQILQQCIEEMTIRNDSSQNYSFSFINIPTVTIYTETSYTDSVPDTAAFAYNTHHNAIERGYRTHPIIPHFFIRYDTKTLKAGMTDARRRVKACVPIVEPVKKTNDPNVETHSASNLFSILYYGDFNGIYGVYEILWNEIEKRGLKPVSDKGEAYGICLVAPYTDKNIDPKKYVTRFAVPVELM